MDRRTEEAGKSGSLAAEIRARSGKSIWSKINGEKRWR